MTTTVNNSPRLELNRAQPGRLPDVLREMKFGDMHAPIKVTVAGLTAGATFDITSQAVRDKVTAMVGRTPTPTFAAGQPDLLPAIGHLVNLRVTAASAGTTVGTYVLTDAAGTPIVPPGGASAAAGIASLSDDGKTLVFPANVTGFILTYFPRAAVAMDSASEVPPAPGT